MKLGDIYRDVVSSLNAPKGRIRTKDVINAINDAITTVRVEHIQNGQGFEFAVTEQVYATMEDIEYPFVRVAELKHNIMRSLPIEWTVRQSMFSKTDNFLRNTQQSWNKGQLAIKGEQLYKCVEPVDNLNTFNLTFRPSSIRNWSKNNKFKFVQGDVVNDGQSFYIALQDYTNDKGDTITVAGTDEPQIDDPVLTTTNVTSTSFTVEFQPATSLADESVFQKLYWRLVGSAYFEARYVPFDQIHQMQLTSFASNHFPFSVKENQIYTTVTNLPFTISYIPEWEPVEDLDKKLYIPDTFSDPVKERAIQKLAFKLNITGNETGTESVE